MQKILLLAAIPHGLRLDKEIREISSAIRRATNRDLFEIRIITAVRPADIRRAIEEEKPQIVHFCGHGKQDGSLLLEDDAGNNKPVSPEGLASLFKLHVDYVNCVLLNACYSEKPAQAISQHINYTIGMNHPIGDKAAIAFAQGFYDGLGYENRDSQNVIQRAFEEGLVAIQMEDFSQGSIPILKKLTVETSKEKVLETQIPLQNERYDSGDDLSSECHINYTILRDLLKVGNWKQADHETRAVMLKIAGREKEGWLNVRSINNFPCTDLHTIDQLWIKYSKKKFGFSVQKQIWENIGSGDVFNDEVWVSFGDCVGWRTTRSYQFLFTSWTSREWSNYSEINFNLDAPSGHLPRMWDEWRGGFELSSLIMRLENCNIKRDPAQTEFDVNSTGSIDDLSSKSKIDYTRLRDLLASGKWKEADRETFAVMLKVAGREKQGWLDIQSFNNFPCTDLHAINQLWVKYSNGQFGFSVQKRIWQEVGGKVDVETECRLGDRVGWRVNNKWLGYSNFIFTKNAPQGHFPVCWWDMYFAIAGSPGTTTSSLLARFKRCNIESVPPQIEVDVEGSINDTRSERIIDYTKLRNLLASENWKYADLETRSIILQLTHREEKGWLDIESVYNLPYPSLCIINELWLKYSHGHFGFSVQKHIWEDVKESEKDFGYKVGWSVLGKWIYHYNLTFSLDAPPGHLPFWGRGWSDQRQWVKEVQIGRWADALLERYDLS